MHLANGSFGWNHYGTKWSTGKRMAKEDCKNGFHWSFGRTEQVAEKDGVQIGVKGENGHPYIGELLSLAFCPPDKCGRLTSSAMGIPKAHQLYQ